MYTSSNIFSNNSYSRENAVEYAVKYALNPNPAYRYFSSYGDGGGDCSNFISQCLKAGGAPITYDTVRPWWYNNGGKAASHHWSVSWSVAHSLYWCLKVRGKMKLPGLKGIEVDDIDMLEPGDIIQYEDYNGLIYHSAIITDFTNTFGIKLPLISQHSYDALNTSHIKLNAKRMHFMKIIV